MMLMGGDINVKNSSRPSYFNCRNYRLLETSENPDEWVKVYVDFYGESGKYVSTKWVYEVEQKNAARFCENMNNPIPVKDRFGD